MGIAERYILQRVLLLSAMTLASLVVIVLITQVLVFIHVVTSSSDAILTFLTMSASLIPMVTGIVTPFALLIGVAHTLNNMHTDSEMVVLEAAGISHRLIVRPLMMLAAVASLALLVNSLAIEPAANKKMRDTITQVFTDMIGMAARSEAFYRLEDNLYLQISDALPGGGFAGIFIADLREDETELLYYAQRGSISEHENTNLLVLENGEMHRRNARTGEVSIISYAAYAIDLSQFTAAHGETTYQPKELPLSSLLDPNPNDSAGRWPPQVVRGEVHRRFTDWLYPLAFVPIALYFTVGARSNRQEQMWSLAAAAGTALALRGLGFFFVNLAGRTAWLSAFAYLLPIGCIILFSVLLAIGQRPSLPKRWEEKLTKVWDWHVRQRDRLFARWMPKESGQ